MTVPSGAVGGTPVTPSGRASGSTATIASDGTPAVAAGSTATIASDGTPAVAAGSTAAVASGGIPAVGFGGAVGGTFAGAVATAGRRWVL